MAIIVQSLASELFGQAGNTIFQKNCLSHLPFLLQGPAATPLPPPPTDQTACGSTVPSPFFPPWGTSLEMKDNQTHHNPISLKELLYPPNPLLIINMQHICFWLGHFTYIQNLLEAFKSIGVGSTKPKDACVGSAFCCLFFQWQWRQIQMIVWWSLKVAQVAFPLNHLKRALLQSEHFETSCRERENRQNGRKFWNEWELNCKIPSKRTSCQDSHCTWDVPLTNDPPLFHPKLSFLSFNVHCKHRLDSRFCIFTRHRKLHFVFSFWRFTWGWHHLKVVFCQSWNKGTVHP